MAVSEKETSTRITVLMTFFNRRPLTIRCVRSLQAQGERIAGLSLTFSVVDDGSSDGTSDDLRGLGVLPIVGSGDYYWARGMQVAEHAGRRTLPDHLLWVNDDDDLDEDALSRLLSLGASLQSRFGEGSPLIVACAMRSATGTTTYSGLRRLGRRPGGFALVEPGGGTRLVDSFQGNLVLINRPAYESIGAIDGGFSHAYGDIDYGLRASRLGIPIVLAPGHFGVCERNPLAGTWRDPTLPVRRRAALLLDRKAFPPGDHWRFTKRHAGAAAPFYFLATYVSSFLSILRGR